MLRTDKGVIQRYDFDPKPCLYEFRAKIGIEFLTVGIFTDENGKQHLSLWILAPAEDKADQKYSFVCLPEGHVLSGVNKEDYLGLVHNPNTNSVLHVFVSKTNI